MESLEAYRLCAPYYRAVMAARKHIEGQVAVVLDLLSGSSLTQPSVLDAACGTGDVLDALLEKGHDAWGVDGSSEMLDHARDLPRLRDGQRLFAPCRWQELDAVFARQRFDCVFILGNALSHLQREEVPRVLEAVVRRGLNPGGMFAFDLRPWVRDAEGRLRQAGRTEGVLRDLGEHAFPGGRIHIADRCTYEGDEQVITYEVRDLVQGQSHTFTLRYSLFDSEDVRTWVECLGAASVEFQPATSEGWAYTVVVVRKLP